MAAQAQIPSEQKETREKTISHTSLQKTQNKEFLSINACYSVTKYYLCRQNNKRSLLGRKQQSQVARSFPNRYLFSYTNKVTSLFSISCILDIILSYVSDVSPRRNAPIDNNCPTNRYRVYGTWYHVRRPRYGCYGGRRVMRTTAVTRACGGRRKVRRTC